MNKLIPLMLILLLISSTFQGVGYANEYNTFSLNKTFMQLTLEDQPDAMTRADLAHHLVDTLGLNPLLSKSNFKDVPKSHPYYQEISTVLEYKLLGTYADGTFKPDHEVTRAEYAVAMSRALKIEQENTGRVINDIDLHLHQWYVADVYKMVNVGLMTLDNEGNFRPQEPMVMNEKAKLQPLFSNGHSSANKVIWDSSDPTIATVSQTGQVVPKGVGLAIISAMTADGTKLKTCIVSVRASENSESEDPYIFSDIKNHWAKVDILEMKVKGVVTGVSEKEFKPERAVTRSEFAALLLRILQIEPTEIDQSYFKDIEIDKWYAEVVEMAFKEGLIEGYPDKTFKPNENITRQEMAVLIIRAINYVEKNVDIAADGSLHFKDSEKIRDWARVAITLVSELGIMNGYPDDTFGPDHSTKRAESVVALKRLLDLLVTDNHVGPILFTNGVINGGNQAEFTFEGKVQPGSSVSLQSIVSENGTVYNVTDTFTTATAAGEVTITKDLMFLEDGIWNFSFYIKDNNGENGTEKTIALIKDTKIICCTDQNTDENSDTYSFTGEPNLMANVTLSQDSKTKTYTVKTNENGQATLSYDGSLFMDGKINVSMSVRDQAGNIGNYESVIVKNSMQDKNPELGIERIGFNIPITDAAIHPIEPIIYVVSKANMKLYIANYETQELQSYPLSHFPSEMSLSEDGTKLYIVNMDDETLFSVFDLKHQEWEYHAKTQPFAGTHYDDTHRHIYNKNNKIFVVIDTWAPKLLVFDAYTYRPVTIPEIDSIGAMAFSKNSDFFYYWHQYGWGAGWAGSNIYKYYMNGDEMVKVAETNIGYPGLLRDPLDAPILLLEDKRIVISKEFVFSADDLTMLKGTFPEPIYAANAHFNIAIGKNGVYNLDSFEKIYSPLFSFVYYDVRKVFSKNNEMIVLYKKDNALIVEKISLEEAKSFQNDLLSFQVAGVEGKIDGNYVTVELPTDVDLTDLTATFTHSPSAVVEVDRVIQKSGITKNDFQNPVVYTVVAEDGTKKFYKVIVKHMASQ
ncbi:S-layer homology domain-containing protein [Anaerobacillus sp. MEB173]|uniref:S-layer homology domain-containing protein n=1 Tax=Anaerobacillus sp. MEB173 TaxID=3383345 RepID=UPI003F92CB9D